MNTPIMNQLPLYLKSLRQNEHYTQDFVARKLGISRQSYSHYEHGRAIPDIHSLFLLSTLYQIPIDTFFYSQSAQNGQDTGQSDNSVCRHLEKALSFSREFLSYFQNTENQRKYHHLTRIEKTMLFYFKNLNSNDQKEMLLFTYLKYSKKAENK